ncbi:MAG: transketolase family protein [Acetivibrionales bacterium]|jgi:transketolase
MLEKDNKEMRVVYTETMEQMLDKYPDIIMVEADLSSAIKVNTIKKTRPDRIINVGVAEANMVGVAAGLATLGKRPVCHTFAAFMSRRVYDQVCVSVAYAGLNVKLIGSDPGVSAERNGGTHMAIEDVGIMRSMPTMRVFEPCDNVQLRKSLPIVLNLDGPVYIRLYRRIPYKIYDDNYQFTFGKADILRNGEDATIIASGVMVRVALQAADLLKEEGVGVRVINMHTVKPLDEEAVIRAAKETGAIVTAENNNYLNGLGSAVAEVLCERDVHVPLRRVGIKDHFGEVGTEEYLLKKFQLAPENVAEAVKEVLTRKK